MKKTKLLLLAAFMAIIMSVAFSSAYPVTSYARPTYYNQYNYNHNSMYYGADYVPVNSFGKPSQPYYANVKNGRFYGNGIYPLMQNDCNSIYGCRQVQSANMRVDNALDHAYYTNPQLFAPRYMDSKRYVKGSQGYYGLYGFY